jgi:putative SOS response-associated peptidase YedK
MCANFENRQTWEEIHGLYHLTTTLRDYHPSLNLRPDNAILVIGPDGAAMRRWGLKVKWDNKLIINARSETITEKASFRPLLEQRCLIPATGWFEWQAIPNAKRKRKHRLQPEGQHSFSFAGLSDGERVVMLTRAPAPEIAHVHDRMPAVLSRADEQRWLDPAAKFEQAREALANKSDRYLAQPLEDMPPVKPVQTDLFG